MNRTCQDTGSDLLEVGTPTLGTPKIRLGHLVMDILGFHATCP